jgi:hypothetical protein
MREQTNENCGTRFNDFVCGNDECKVKSEMFDIEAAIILMIITKPPNVLILICSIHENSEHQRALS